ncbi:erythromycin esterase [Wenjunlia vitaminophila]|uniref:Erythromycin esterase n=1 Tax=Wenjunlia vitaminophila TaxID=76728 RepID=A0A0T6LSW4_WENVI|nr:erythromycin esterase family protein [Wenjunlia vitaminophila]KRV48914.1 erythromycin esterase [Wenjunlia vitaminophila]
MAERVFRDRTEAGQVLAGLLGRYRDDPDVIVLGLARGGVPVAYEVGMALHVPLDVFLVRKLGVPGQEELAMGAIASGGGVVLNEDLIRGLGISADVIEQVAQREGEELLRRERLYREGRPVPELTGRTVLLVDDGLATGASMRAALKAVSRSRPSRTVVAVPAAPDSACDALSRIADEVVCATTPSPFIAVGASYWDFAQTTDDEVRNLLREAVTARSSDRPVPTPPPYERPAPHATPTPPSPSATQTTSVTPATPTSAPSVAHAAIRDEAMPVRNGVPSDEALFDLVGDAHLVLIGEASHGTHEFYSARAQITRRLIEEKGFGAVAVEGDWPDAYRVNRYVQGQGEAGTAEEALRGFERFPAWMWRNVTVLEFVDWLREHNDRVNQDQADGARARVGFYGLDLYSLYRSIDEVIGYLDRIDPDAAARARERYACLDHHNAGEGGAQAYGFRAAFGAGDSCEREIIDELVDLRHHAQEYAHRDGLIAEDEFFDAEQNARTVHDAAEYYQNMFSTDASTWNLRDRHMADTLRSLVEHLGRTRPGRPPKVVVWAHNSHLGDARATEAATNGELNLGQLVREWFPGDCRIIGLSTYTGTVTAAENWGDPAERRRIRPALDNSVEQLLHEVGRDEFWLPFPSTPRCAEVLRASRLQRGIGVIYRPRTERESHYFHARVADQFDALIHIDETHAVEPLERSASWERGEVPETYPSTV